MLMQFQDEIMQPVFWLALGKVIWIDIFLSGDNALVIAMACRGLPAKQRFWGMILGAAAAVTMRITFTGIVAHLMKLPYLKLAGGAALMVVAAKLLVPEKEGDEDMKSADRLWSAVRIVMVADMVMSLDNVIAVAAAANGSMLLLALGLLISIPLIVAGASLIMGVLNRFPILVWAGAALLGWISGEVIAADPIISRHLAAPFDEPIIFAGLGVAVVLAAGATWRTLSQPNNSPLPRTL